MAEMDDDALLAALGVEAAPAKAGGRTALEERLIAGFEDILRFVEGSGRPPQHGEDRDIFERLYAVRLDRLRAMPEALALLAGMDTQGLLQQGTTPSPAHAGMDDASLLDELGVDAPPAEGDITRLRHVKSHAERQVAEEIANRQRCEDFESFRPLFAEVDAGLKSGAWITKPFARDASIEVGDFFIVAGQLSYVSGVVDGGKTRDGRDNPRLRVIFGNETESNLLLRSLSRSLYPDGDTPVGRRVVKVDAGPLFGDTLEPDDVESGTIYVLQSRSEHPYVAQHRKIIHKIGVTGGKIETRISGARDQSTYLLADVDIVATYKLAHINRTKLENLFHRIFAPAHLDLTIEDRFGKPVKPREWFLVPLSVIDEAVSRVRDGSITEYVYDPTSASLVRSKP